MARLVARGFGLQGVGLLHTLSRPATCADCNGQRAKDWCKHHPCQGSKARQACSQTARCCLTLQLCDCRCCSILQEATSAQLCFQSSLRLDKAERLACFYWRLTSLPFHDAVHVFHKTNVRVLRVGPDPRSSIPVGFAMNTLRFWV